MPNHLLAASSTLLFLTLSACGSVTVDEEPKCPDPDLTQSIFFPAANPDLPPFYFAGVCLEAPPLLDPSGRADCVVIVASHATGTPTCNESDGLTPVSAEHAWALKHLTPGQNPHAEEWNTFCEVPQLDPASVGGQRCRDDESHVVSDENGDPVHGFCYVDETTNPPSSETDLPRNCPVDQKRGLRFTESAGTLETAEDRSVIILCSTRVCIEG